MRYCLKELPLLPLVEHVCGVSLLTLAVLQFGRYYRLAFGLLWTKSHFRVDHYGPKI